MKNKIMILALAILVAAVSFVALVYTLNKSRAVADIQELDSATDRISSQLGNAFAYVDILELSIEFDGENYSEKKFKELTNMAMQHNSCITGFQLAPDAIVSYINPEAGNEAAMGDDLLQNETKKDSVVKAMNSDTIVVQEAVETTNGGVCLYARKAIRTKGKFWGIAILSIDMEKLLAQAGLSNASADYKYCISSYGKTSELSYVWGDESLMNTSCSYSDVELPLGKWRLSIQRNRSLFSSLKIYALFALAAVMIAVTIYIVFTNVARKIHSGRVDQLTGTLNRSEFQRQAEKKIKRNRQMCALLAIDMDKFKYINDTYGHLAGDEVLICCAERMRTAVRKCDLVSRVGGDEFLILLCHLENQKQLRPVIDRVRELGEHEIRLGDHLINPGLSVGYAVAPEEGGDFVSLCEIADKRMYEDKGSRHLAKAE